MKPHKGACKKSNFVENNNSPTADLFVQTKGKNFNKFVTTREPLSFFEKVGGKKIDEKRKDLPSFAPFFFANFPFARNTSKK